MGSNMSHTKVLNLGRVHSGTPHWKWTSVGRSPQRVLCAVKRTFRNMVGPNKKFYARLHTKGSEEHGLVEAEPILDFGRQDCDLLCKDTEDILPFGIAILWQGVVSPSHLISIHL